MGRKLIKPVDDLDLYVEWSSIVEQPISWGTRAEMAEEGWEELDLLRADRYGSTWPKAGKWDIYAQLGILYWKDLPTVIDLYESDHEIDTEDPRILALLEPFE